MKLSIHQLRVNIKSLAAESRYIRQEVEKRIEERSHADALITHKCCRVKPEARLAQLALTFIKNKPRSFAENKFKIDVNAKKLYEKIVRFTSYKERPTIDEVKEWMKT